jgi:hypothetical protein
MRKGERGKIQMRKFLFTYMPASLILVFLAMILWTCGGGGGGGGEPSPIVVSGTVSAPNGQIAFSPKKSLVGKFVCLLTSPAYGSITGLAPVADGVTVELIRLDDSGNEIQVLATTTISGGKRLP